MTGQAETLCDAVARDARRGTSNRLESVVVAPARPKSPMIRNATPRSRSEQEVAGYRDALVRLVPRAMKGEGLIAPAGKGRGARWIRRPW